MVDPGNIPSYPLKYPTHLCYVHICGPNCQLNFENMIFKQTLVVFTDIMVDQSHFCLQILTPKQVIS